MYKITDIKKTIYGQNNLNCLISIEKTCNGLYFNDLTKKICIKIDNDKLLNKIINNNTWEF